MTGSNRILVACVLALGLAAPAGAQLDDSALFSTQVPPNVIMLVDNSGSMHHIVWHPAYDPSVTPTCTNWTNTSQYFYTTNTTLTRCGNTRTIYVDPAVSPGSSTRWWGQYLNWYFSDAADAYASEIAALTNGIPSTCLGGSSFSLYRRSRVTAAQQILRDVICNVNQSGAVRFGIAKFRRGSDPEGGYVRVPANDYLDVNGDPNVYTLNGVSQSHGDHLDDAIDELTGEAWTPLSETLLHIYMYFMDRNSADRPYGQDGTTRFPEYEFSTSWTINNGGPYDDDASSDSDANNHPGTPPDHPVQWACQKNFVIILTDGEPTKDDFDLDAPDDVGFSDFGALIGDYIPGDETETGVTCTGCNETTLYLDDIARFMQETDFLPNETDFPEDQVIDVYTVGFTTTAFANDILSRTAVEGNGTFYTSNDAETLSQAIVDTVTDIVRKSQAFTAPTVPASRTSDDGKLYTSYFVPSRANAFWEGHLQSWTINLNGDVLDKFGVCALVDPDAGECNDGPFLASAVPHWDAADEVPAPASRNLFMSQLTASPGVSQKVAFNVANADATALGITAADVALYPSPVSGATTTAELSEMVVQNIRGCEFGTGTTSTTCVQRLSMLGDMFHSAPVVIPHPPGGSSIASYNTFSNTYRDRDRVMVVGANDGFFHIFHAGTYDSVTGTYDAGTGVEVAGFMPYAARQNAKQLPIDTNARDYYTVDGSPTVVDAWLYSSPTSNTRIASGVEWRTIAMSGLRQGGRSYFALDITDPSDVDYPDYMWEFPREDAPASITDYMGETWSKPVITRIRVQVGMDNNGGQGYERWVAIFGGGFDPNGDPNDTAAYSPTATAGRSITILDLKTGEIIARKQFDASATDAQADMLYAMPASPAVFDLDFDGYAELIYIGDLGGNVFKWVLEREDTFGEPIFVNDVVNGAGSASQPNLPLVRWFSAPVYDSGTAKYYKSFYNSLNGVIRTQKLWLVFGSGERSNLPFLGLTGTDQENNRLYSIKDVDPYDNSSLATITEASLDDLTGNTGCASLSNVGFYLRGEDGEKFVSELDILFFYVFAISYKPVPSTNPCESSGEVFLYAFRVYCGQNLFEDGGGNPVVKISLDEETFSDPTITVGADVEIKTGSPDGVGGPPKPPLKINDVNGPVYWRELRFGQDK